MTLQAHETTKEKNEISILQDQSSMEVGVEASYTVEERHTVIEDAVVLEFPPAECTTGIATGNWGCGAFGGDVELKSLLQWIAASQVITSIFYLCRYPLEMLLYILGMEGGQK